MCVLKVISLLSLAFILVGILLTTITFDNDYHVLFLNSGVLQIVVYVILTALVVFLVAKLKVGKKAFCVCLFFYVIVNLAFVLLMQLWPTYDQYYMTWIASGMLEGDFSQFAPYGYIDLFPHQYSFLEYVKAIFYVFGTDNYIVLQLLNVVYLLAIILIIVKICENFEGGGKKQTL